MLLVKVVQVTVLLSTAVSLVQSQGCTKSVLGGGYTGSVQRTVAGLTCQRWDAQYPFNHTYTNPKYFPDDTLAEAANNCRNPDMADEGVWCFTTNSSVRWQYCDVPMCSPFPECKLTEPGTEYRGTRAHTQTQTPCYPTNGHDVCRNPDGKPGGPWCYTDDKGNWELCDVPFCKVSSSCKNNDLGKEYVGSISVTANGRPCQRWDKQFPHHHPYTDPDMFPDATIKDANNYCRNPDGDPRGLWCFTQDPKSVWEYCDIDICLDCKVTTQGKEYSGTLSWTAAGNLCQRWDSQSPHAHNLTDPNRYPDASLENAANYCRNPDGKSSGPWCFTTNPDIEWETCAIKPCEGCQKEVPSFRKVRHVVHLGLDGLAPCFVKSPGGVPNITSRLVQKGAYTINGARTVLQSVSGPGWGATQFAADMESLGILGNDWRAPWKGWAQNITPTTGLDIPFPTVYRHLKSQDINIRTATFYDWPWHHNIMDYGDPDSVDYDHYCSEDIFGVDQCDAYNAGNASVYLRKALLAAESTYTFVYFDSIDHAGHAAGWCSEHYLQTVDIVDGHVGKVLDAIDDAGMTDEVLILLSSDHGGKNMGHGCWEDACLLTPLLVKGPGVKVNHQFTHAVHNQDIAPTAMHAMGFRQSPWWRGWVMMDAFD